MQQDVDQLMIITQPESGILQIHLNQPDHLNALSYAALEQLSLILKDAKNNRAIRAVLLTGAGKGFCAGADIKELAQLNAEQGLAFARFGQSVFRQLELLGKPSLAAIHGFALGGGLELAMSATIRIAATHTRFGQPEIKLGVIPGFGGTQRLARLIGKGRALYLCLTGQLVTAEEVCEWGLVSAVVPAETLQTHALTLLRELTQFSSQALASVITTIQLGYDLSLEEASELEAAHFGLCCSTPDKTEGVNAFLEKKEAVFNREHLK